MGLDIGASQALIKKRYRILSWQFHPDGGVTPDEEIFKLISEANEIIGNPEKRKAYDKVMKHRVDIKLVDALEAYFEDPKKADGLFYYDTKTGNRVLKISKEIIAEAMKIDPIIIPWAIKKLNTRSRKQGYNPFVFSPEYLLTDGNKISEHIKGPVLESAKDNLKNI